jgi:hypothetical protein
MCSCCSYIWLIPFTGTITEVKAPSQSASCWLVSDPPPSHFVDATPSPRLFEGSPPHGHFLYQVPRMVVLSLLACPCARHRPKSPYSTPTSDAPSSCGRTTGRPHYIWTMSTLPTTTREPYCAPVWVRVLLPMRTRPCRGARSVSGDAAACGRVAASQSACLSSWDDMKPWITS